MVKIVLSACSSVARSFFLKHFPHIDWNLKNNLENLSRKKNLVNNIIESLSSRIKLDSLPLKIENKELNIINK